MYLDEAPEIAAGLNHWLENDARFQELCPDGHRKRRESRMGGLAGLARIVAGQQISTHAAASVWNKYLDFVNDPNDAAHIISLDEDGLRGCGLSRPKIKYVRGAAQAILDGDIDPDTWGDMPADEVYEQIISLKGFGPWSAQVYLMFYLQKGDIWPAADLGIQIGLQKYACLNNRPDEKQTYELGQQFAPYRSAAALLLLDIKDGGIE